jgi:flagellar FliL protein
MKKEPAKKEKTGSGKPRNLKKWLLIIVPALALVIVVAGQVSSRYFRQATENGEARQGEEAPAVQRPSRLHGPLEFTVNLADAGQRRYLKVTISLAFTDRALTDELVSSEAKLRDLIIGVLRGKKAAEVADPGGTEKLRNEIIAALNAALIEGQITTLYFTEFLIQ